MKSILVIRSAVQGELINHISRMQSTSYALHNGEPPVRRRIHKHNQQQKKYSYAMHCYVKSHFGQFKWWCAHMRACVQRCENESNLVTKKKSVTNRKKKENVSDETHLNWTKSVRLRLPTADADLRNRNEIIVIKVEMLPYHPNCVAVQKWWIAILCNWHGTCSHVLLEVCQTSDWQKSHSNCR